MCSRGISGEWPGSDETRGDDPVWRGGARAVCVGVGVWVVVCVGVEVTLHKL